MENMNEFDLGVKVGRIEMFDIFIQALTESIKKETTSTETVLELMKIQDVMTKEIRNNDRNRNN